MNEARFVILHEKKGEAMAKREQVLSALNSIDKQLMEISEDIRMMRLDNTLNTAREERWRITDTLDPDGYGDDGEEYFHDIYMLDCLENDDPCLDRDEGTLLKALGLGHPSDIALMLGVRSPCWPLEATKDFTVIWDGKGKAAIKEASE